MPSSQAPQAPAQNSQRLLRAALTSPESYASTLLTVFVDRYGTDGLGWAPETIRLQLRDDFGVQLSRGNFDRLMAAITLVTDDAFYQNLPKFIELCNVLAGSTLDPGTFDPADATECAWGITEALLISPPESAEPFCDDIRHYLTAVLKDEGFVTPPDVLRIALDADFAEQVRYSFADDPEMFSAIWQTQQSNTQRLNDALRDGLTELFNQLRALPLRNGSAEKLLSRLPEHIRAGH